MRNNRPIIGLVEMCVTCCGARAGRGVVTNLLRGGGGTGRGDAAAAERVALQQFPPALLQRLAVQPAATGRVELAGGLDPPQSPVLQALLLGRTAQEHRQQHRQDLQAGTVSQCCQL